MAFETGFPSLSFSPLPPLSDKVSRGRPAKLFRGLEGGLITEIGLDRLPKEKLVCRDSIGEPPSVSTIQEVSEHSCEDDGDCISWFKLAKELVPVTAEGDSLPFLATDMAHDCADEYQWNPFRCFIGSDDAAANGSIGNAYGFSATAALQSNPPPPSKQKQEDPEKEDFHVNVGYAIRTLREELPCMFYKELTYDIYRKDIVFCDPANIVGGMNNYKLIFRALRFHGKIFFKALWVDILRIWQPSDNVIMVRWQVRGIPRVPWEAQGIFDGTSEYKLDKQGKIYEHKVDNVALNARPKFKVATVVELLRVGTCPSTPKPTFYENMCRVLMVLMPYLLQFTWVRYYFALKGTVGLYQFPNLV